MCRKAAGWSRTGVLGCAVIFSPLPAGSVCFPQEFVFKPMSIKITPQLIKEYMSDCTLCPRACHADRLSGQKGFCGQDAELAAARAALHFWEEPCISGCSGSGTVFFSGCSLQCVFCQNHDIALGKSGRKISVERLAEVFLELQAKGAANINLVTPSHFIPQICLALEQARSAGLSVPIVYNSSGYEETASLELLEGRIDIYLPDLKYFSPEAAAKYSHAPGYFEKASAAIAEMLRQVGKPVFDAGTGLLKKGVLVRHLLLPGQSADSKKILRYLHDTYYNDIYVSIMNQYTPLPHVAAFPEINREITDSEYGKILDFADKIGIEQGYMQEGGTAAESFIPSFDGEGL